MANTLSPTCVLVSSSCSLKESPENKQLVTTFSGIDSTASTTDVRPTTPTASASTGLVRSSPSGCLQHQHHQQSVGVGAGSSPSNRSSQGASSPNALRPISPACEGEELHDNEQPQVSSPKSPKSLRTGWKTSKFFSKSMTSGEIIRGLKKLSLSASSSSNNTSEEQQLGSSENTSGSTTTAINKSFILRLTNFKKRSSCGPEDLPQDSEIAATGQQTNKSGEVSKVDEGIVCKKEDLKAIICNATRRIPLCSPRKKKALRQTKSASFEPPDDKTKKPPVRRAGSEESKSRKLTSDQQLTPKAEKKVTRSCSPVPPKENPSVVFTSPHQTEPVQLQQVVPVDQTTCVSKVKWDECDVVDAGVIGDAIESFLKGSMAYPEKDTKLFPKMTFRKNSFEKKS